MAKNLRGFGGLLLCLFVLPCGLAAKEFASRRLTVEGGTGFVLHHEDGRRLTGRQLEGAIFVIKQSNAEARVRIDGVSEMRTIAGPLTLYRLMVQNPGGGESPLCEPDAYGRRAGFPVPDGAGSFSLTCTSGAESKCIALGYRPWEDAAGWPMKDLHQACMRAIRADYGGDGVPLTRNGTRIEVYDRVVFRTPTEVDDLKFEAAFGIDGAVCIARPRIHDIATLDDLGHRYPRLEGALGPEACTEDAMRGNPSALIFVRSTP